MRPSKRLSHCLWAALFALPTYAQTVPGSSAHIYLIGENDKLVLVGQGETLNVAKGRTGPLSDREMASSLVVTNVPVVPSVERPSRREDTPESESPTVPPPLAATQEEKTAQAQAAAPSGPSPAPHAVSSFPVEIDMAVDPANSKPAVNGVPESRKASVVGAESLGADPLPVDVLRPDDLGYIYISAQHRRNVRSPFDPARVIFATPEENTLRVEGVVIGFTRVARVGKANMVAGDTLAGSGLVVNAIRPDGVIFRMRSGVRLFAPIARDIRIISEE